MRTVRSFANEEGEATQYSNCLGMTYKLYKTNAVLYAGFVWATQVRHLACIFGGVLYC